MAQTQAMIVTLKGPVEKSVILKSLRESEGPEARWADGFTQLFQKIEATDINFPDMDRGEMTDAFGEITFKDLYCIL